MTRVDFYLTEQTAPTARLLLACRLAEKAYGQDHQVYIHTGDRPQAEQVDGLLWTFRDGSFVPHCLFDDADHVTAEVIIGYNRQPESAATDVLINLCNEVPSFFSRFERIAEIVHQEVHTRERARERFRFYKERGYALQTHQLSS